jgi:hypothetical protein
VSAPKDLADTLSRFADRLFVTGGTDPGEEHLPIEPSRLAVYHELVRGNYTSMIRFAYTMTFRLVAAEITESDPAPELPESVHEIIQRYLEVSPAGNHSTRHIADVFRTFFEKEYAGLIERRPEIPDLMTLERAELAALYAFDDPGRSPDDDELAALQQGDVGAFLALRVLRAPSAAALRLDWPASEIRHRYVHRRPVAPGELTGSERVIVSRDPRTLEVGFTVLEEAPFLALELAPGGEPFTVEELAVRWMEALPDELAAHDDAWKLTTLASAVMTGLHNGTLRLA